MKHIYLDHAAATPLDSRVFDAMLPYLTDQFYNPSATYLAARSVRHAVDDARARVAAVLAVRPREVVFTAGATEANNLAIHGVMAKFPEATILVTAIEHDSVLVPAQQYDCKTIPVKEDGRVSLDTVRGMLADDVVMVSAMYVNNETGSVQDIVGISKLIKKERARRKEHGNPLPLYLHTDAAQAPNYHSVHPHKLGVDMMSLNGGKIYGPKQSGALYITTGVEIEPLMYGGGQEFGLRSGTENVANIIGFSAALEQAAGQQLAEYIRMTQLWSLFMTELKQNIPKASITSKTPGNIMHITIPGIDNERVMMELDERGIQCAVGSACSASNDEPSHVLRALGMTEAEAQTSLRFSMGRTTTKDDVLTTIQALREILHV